MSTHKNLITLCFAAVFTLGLAACGGGGSGPAPTADMDSDTDGGDTDGDVSLEGKYIASGTMIAVAGVPDAMLPIESGATLLLPGLGTVECVSDDGCLGTVANGVLTIMGNLKIVSVDPALDDATATVLAGLVMDTLPGPAGPTPDEVAAAATKAALTKAMAINTEADAAPGEDSAAFDDTDDGEEYTLTIAHKDGAQSIMVNDPGMADDDDPKFVMMDGKYVRAMEADDDGNVVTEIVVAHTDIAAPKATAFAMVHELNSNLAEADDDTTNQSIDVDASGGDTNNLAMVMSDTLVVSGTGAGTVNLGADDDTTDDMNEGQFAGTFNGAPGTYECTTDGGCTAVFTLKGTSKNSSFSGVVDLESG